MTDAPKPPRGFALLAPAELKAISTRAGAVPHYRGFNNPETARKAALKRWGKALDSGKALGDGRSSTEIGDSK